MTDKEVMQQALDALENHSGNYKFTNAEYVARLAAITELKNAIAQPVQPAPMQRYEPEIWREERIRMESDTEGDWVKWSDAKVQRRAHRVPLTIEQIYDLWPIKYSAFCEESTKFARAIEAAHGVKETK